MYRRLFGILAIAALVAGACSSSPTRKIVVAEWQFPSTVNVYYAQGVTDVEAGDSMLLNLVDVTTDLRTIPDLVPPSRRSPTAASRWTAPAWT